MSPASRPVEFLIGTYTEEMPHVRGRGEGIHLAALDPATGRAERLSVVRGPRNPSYLAVLPSGEGFYCVQETEAWDDPRIHAFALDRRARAAAPIGSAPAGGGQPCHLSLSRSGTHLFVSNYGGSLACLPLAGTGAPAGAPAVLRREGPGPHPLRQESTHVHCACPDPTGSHVAVCDLGTDEIRMHALEGGGIGPSPPRTVRAAPGAGPRHARFSPDGHRLFVVNELDSTLTAFDHDGGGLAGPLSVSTLPPGWRGENCAAAVTVHPGGRFVYASNRGHDSIAVFEAERDGGLRAAGWHPAGGRTPRDIAIDPTGRFLVAANQDSDLVTVFAIDPQDGALARTGGDLPVASPACIAFLP